MHTNTGLVVTGILAGAFGAGCMTAQDDAAPDGGPVPKVAVVLDGTRYAPADVAQAIAGRQLHYVATDPAGGELHAFDDVDEAIAFARSLAASHAVSTVAAQQPLAGPGPVFYQDDLPSTCSFATAVNLPELFTIGGVPCRRDWNDQISALNTKGNIVTLYTDINFGGPSMTFVGLFPKLSPFGWNDRVSSIKFQ